MEGLMMKQELMISDLLEHAAKVHKDREIYTLNTDMTEHRYTCLLYTSPSPRDQRGSRMPSSA